MRNAIQMLPEIVAKHEDRMRADPLYLQSYLATKAATTAQAASDQFSKYLYPAWGCRPTTTTSGIR